MDENNDRSNCSLIGRGSNSSIMRVRPFKKMTFFFLSFFSFCVLRFSFGLCLRMLMTLRNSSPIFIYSNPQSLNLTSFFFVRVVLTSKTYLLWHFVYTPSSWYHHYIGECLNKRKNWTILNENSLCNVKFHFD